MEKDITYCCEVANISTEFELLNTTLKKEYLLKNILKYNSIASQINGNKGTFCTGYPFYVLSPTLEGDLPIINEQLRYNEELIKIATGCKYSKWTCAHCLSTKGSTMPDLKTICKTCPNMDDGLKPRKIINRLPDIDFWLVCEDHRVEEAKLLLESLFKENNMYPSDINPLKTIDELKTITKDLKNDTMPSKYLPLDVHIINYSTFLKLIEKVPEVLINAKNNNKTPYLPIHPFSLRKKWQQDDEPYNFIQDYLLSITDFNFEPTLKNILTITRTIIANTYTIDELYEIMLSSGPESVVRRHQTKELKLRFEERIKSWKN